MGEPLVLDRGEDGQELPARLLHEGIVGEESGAEVGEPVGDGCTRILEEPEHLPVGEREERGEPADGVGISLDLEVEFVLRRLIRRLPIERVAAVEREERGAVDAVEDDLSGLVGDPDGCLPDIPAPGVDEREPERELPETAAGRATLAVGEGEPAGGRVIRGGYRENRVLLLLQPDRSHSREVLPRDLLHAAQPIRPRGVRVPEPVVVAAERLCKHLSSHQRLDHPDELGGFHVGDAGDEVVRVVEPVRLDRHRSCAPVERERPVCGVEEFEHGLDAGVGLAEEEGVVLVLDVDGHGLVQPDLERAPPGHFGAVLVVVVLVDLHPDQVLEGRVGGVGPGHEPVRGDRRVPDVLHPAEVGVLHGDLPVDRPGVGVTRRDGRDEVVERLPGLFERTDVAGAFRFVAHPHKPPHLLPGLAVAVLCRPGEEVDPDHGVREDLERTLRSLRLRAGFREEFEGKRPSVGILELAPVGVVAPHPEEEEVGRHRGSGVLVPLDGAPGCAGYPGSCRVAV